MRLHLPIQDPCHEDWTAMERHGSAQRFCDVCTKHVHDVSAMTERAARSVLAAETAKGRVCVRYALDESGEIKFAPETVEAPSIWSRMTLAAASVAMALLTGCIDGDPDRIGAEQCVYEVGPWSFVADRGEGTCPAVESEEPEPMMVGELEAVVDPPIAEPFPEPEGEIPEPRELKGDIGPVVEPPPVQRPHKMGKIAIKPPPEPEPVMMGAIAKPIVDEPCDPPAEPPQDQ